MSRLRGAALFVVLATVWGLSFPAITVGLEALPPVLFAAFRYDVGAALLLGYVAVARDPGEWLPSGRENLHAVVAGGVFLVFGNGLLFVGQQTTPSAVAAILQGLIPIVTTLWTLVLLPDERVTPLTAAGIALGFLGVGLVVRPDPGNLLGSGVVGRLLILSQVVSVSLAGVLIQRAGPTMPRESFTGWAMALEAVLLHAASLAAGESPFAVAYTTVAVGAVVYLGVFSTALAFLVYFTLLAERGALETSLVTYLVPVVATVAGVALLGESIAALTFLGFAVIVAGFALLNRRALADLLT